MTLTHAFLVSLPTTLDLQHALFAYGSIVGCALSLWAVGLLVSTIASRVAKLQRRRYVIKRLMHGDKR